MNPEISLTLILASILCLQNGSNAQEISYDDGEFVACKYETRQTIYGCRLNITQANFNKNITRIGGQHENGRTDDDVESLRNLHGDKLKTFSSIFCQKFPNLKIIHISKAGLDAIDKNSLLSCKKVKEFFLSENSFRVLPENLLIANSKMTELWLPNNQLTTLPEKIFLNQKELETVILNKNQINFLPSNIFHPLGKLTRLDLTGNQLKSLNTEWFANLKNLQILHLSKNQISEIPSNFSSSLNNLGQLWLNENKIKVLNPESFVGLQSLVDLNLNHNQISDLPPQVFVKSKYLYELHLSWNNLTTIHSDSFSDHPTMLSVQLRDNQINAIDEAFIEKSKAGHINMKGNVCSQSDSQSKYKIMVDLRKCFDNYLPRRYNISSCGKPLMGQGYIIGGTSIVPGSYPWIAAMVTNKFGKTNQYFCGGTVVSSRKIVTAAHCIQEKGSTIPFQAYEIKVLLGVHDLNQQSEDGRVTHDVQNIHIHSSWNASSDRYDADIAVLMLKTEVEFGSSIQPICLMEFNMAMAKIKDAVVVGYGKSEDESKLHENIPKILEVPIHKNEVCFLENNNLAKFSSQRTFCGGSGNGTGICRGDSGSGVVVNFKEAYFLRGIVSASLYNGDYSCDVNTYAIFTDALKFIDWIEEIPVPTIEHPKAFDDLPIWD